MILRAWLIALLLAVLAIAVACTLYVDGLLRALSHRPRPLPLRVLAPLTIVGCGLASLAWVAIALGGLHG